MVLAKAILFWFHGTCKWGGGLISCSSARLAVLTKQALAYRGLSAERGSPSTTNRYTRWFILLERTKHFWTWVMGRELYTSFIKLTSLYWAGIIGTYASGKTGKRWKRWKRSKYWWYWGNRPVGNVAISNYLNFKPLCDLLANRMVAVEFHGKYNKFDTDLFDQSFWYSNKTTHIPCRYNIASVIIQYLGEWTLHPEIRIMFHILIKVMDDRVQDTWRFANLRL